MEAIIGALTKLVAKAAAGKAFGAEIVGGLYDKTVGGAVSKMFPKEASAYKEMIVDSVMSQGGGSSLDSLIKFFPTGPDVTPGQVRGRMR